MQRFLVSDVRIVRIDVERAEGRGEKPENNISKGQNEGGSGRRKTVRRKLAQASRGAGVKSMISDVATSLHYGLKH